MTYAVVNHTTIGGVIYNNICHVLLKYKRPSCSWSYGGVIYNYICHILLKYKRLSWSWSYGGVIYNYICMITTTMASCISVIYDICSCRSHHHMITTTTASCISVIYDICSYKSHHHMIRCDLQLHMSYITEIQEAVVVVIISWCDLQLHMSYITEIQEASWLWSYGGVIYNYICHILLKYKRRRGRDHMVVWFKTTYVIYYWNTRGRRGRDHMVVWFTTYICHIFLKYKRPSWLWSYGSLIYNYICNQCLSPLKLGVWTPFIARNTQYNIMW
jgi:hypothetical protein